MLRAATRLGACFSTAVVFTACGGTSPTASEPPQSAQLPPPTARFDTGSLERKAIETWSVEDLFPFQVWPEMTGRHRGILMAAGNQPWGGSMFGHVMDLSGERTEYRFYADASSAYAVYFHSPDRRGYEPLDGWTLADATGAEHRWTVAMFQPTTRNPWGLHRLAHLVEVDALRVANPENAIHFVIRDARVLDGSPEFPLLVDDALRALRRRFDEERETQADQIGRHVATFSQSLPPSWSVDDSDETQIAVFPTWRQATPEADEDGTTEQQMQRSFLEATFLARRQLHAEGPAEEQVIPCPPCDCDETTPCVCPACDGPRRETIRPRREALLEFAVHYRADGQMRLLEENVYMPRPQ